MFSFLKKKPAEVQPSPLTVLPAYITGPIPDLGMWENVMPAGEGPLFQNQYGVMQALVANSPIYDFK